jgi:hypothetical protein
VLGVLVLVSLFYAQSSRDDSIARTDEVLVAQELLSRDWVLARNAYVNFASDAILKEIEAKYPAPACSNVVPIASYEFSPAVTSTWSSVRTYLKNKLGVDCTATLSLGLQNAMEGPSAGPARVQSGKTAYAILTCFRSVGQVDLNLQHPFLFKKNMTVTVHLPANNTCDGSVFDSFGVTGVTPNLPPLLDASANYP